MVLDTSVID